jgi:hypothetical protein
MNYKNWNVNKTKQTREIILKYVVVRPKYWPSREIIRSDFRLYWMIRHKKKHIILNNWAAICLMIMMKIEVTKEKTSDDLC